MPRVLRSCLHSSLENMRSPAVLKRRQGRSTVSIIIITRRPGRPAPYSKSELGWSPCLKRSKQTHNIVGGSGCLTIWCESRRGKFAFILITFWATTSPMNQQTSSWFSSDQISHPGFSHSTLGSSAASRLITDIDSAKKRLKEILVVKQIFIRSTSSRLCTWLAMLGTM